MTGWRLGCAADPPQMIQTMNQGHPYNLARAISFAQEGLSRRSGAAALGYGHVSGVQASTGS